MKETTVKPVREPLWDVHQLAEFLAVPVQTIYDWRCKGYGPASMKVGRYVRYRESDVMAWLDSQTSQAA